jgi:hypothetical protein
LKRNPKITSAGHGGLAVSDTTLQHSTCTVAICTRIPLQRFPLCNVLEAFVGTSNRLLNCLHIPWSSFKASSHIPWSSLKATSHRWPVSTCLLSPMLSGLF